MTNPIPRIDPEFKALIPPLSKDEYHQLEQNILTDKKCRDAIVVWGNTIVDGHNRFRICVAHGITFEIKEVDFASRDEAMVWILDNQLGRRNLSEAVRIELAINKCQLLREQAREKQSRAGGDKTKKSPDKAGFTPSYDQDGALLAKVSNPEEGPVNVRKAIADDAGVGERTVHRYKQASMHPELQEAVKNGELQINTAFRLTPQELEKQCKASDKQLRFVENHIPIAGNEAANHEIREKLLELLAHLEAVKEAYSE